MEAEALISKIKQKKNVSMHDYVFMRAPRRLHQCWNENSSWNGTANHQPKFSKTLQRSLTTRT